MQTTRRPTEIAIFTTVSGDPCARSYVKHNAEHSRTHQKSQFYYSFGRSMRTILRKTQCGTLAEHQKSQFYYSFGRSMRTILRKTQFRPLAEQTAHNRNRNFTTVSGDAMRTILRKGCRGTTEIAILLQFRAIDAHDPT